VTRVLTSLPVVLPLLGAGATLLAGHHPKVQRILSIWVLAAVLGVSLTLLVLAHDDGATAMTVGGWPEPLGITLVVDRLSALMLSVSATVTLGVLVYAVAQGTADGDDVAPVSIFHPTFLVLSAGVSTAFLSGDLFNLYVGFEVLLSASYVLLTLGGTGPRVQAGVTYVVVSLLSSLIFLAGIAFVYAATGTLNMAQLAVRLDEVPEGTRTAMHLVLLVAFGIKAAVFPLSAWLPDSYPTALAPVTAVFAGLLTKVGVYAIIRTETLLLPGDALGDLLMWVALATMVVGILGAIAQTDIKRMLSFTLVSHIGYMVFGVALGTASGVAGAVFYVAHHILIQTTLFLAIGLVERQSGSTSLKRLGGLAAASPALAVLFFVPAMNLAGIPPFSGFIGKVGLLEAGAQVGTGTAWALVAGGVVTSLLTLYAVAKVWSKAFWRPVEDAPAYATASEARGAHVAGLEDLFPDVQADHDGDDDGEGNGADGPVPPMMILATTAMLVVTLLLTVLAGPLYEIASQASTDLLDRQPYLDAVFPDGVPE
jgi:multicomponent Na+:H+ antiporter subunit D